MVIFNRGKSSYFINYHLTYYIIFLFLVDYAHYVFNWGTNSYLTMKIVRLLDKKNERGSVKRILLRDVLSYLEQLEYQRNLL